MPRKALGRDPSRQPYLVASRRPLPILFFLLPLILAYELCLAVFLRHGDGVLTNKAHETLLGFFNAFGIAPTGGLFLGGAVIVVVLVIWHLLEHDPWRFDPVVPAFMALESIVLAIPLIVVGVVIANRHLAATPGSVDIAGLGLLDQLAISIGAGLYEELLFRMLLIAVVHTLLVDLARLPAGAGGAMAVSLSAAAFCWYHLPGDLGSGVFYFLAGLYFGTVFLWRGFGIVAGVHAVYDVIVVLLMKTAGSA